MLVPAVATAPAAVIDVLDPDDGSLVGTVPAASATDVEAALARAVDGARTSRRLPVHRRIEILGVTASLLDARREAFATTIAREGIKTIREARAEAARAAETLRLSAEEARRVVGETIPFDQRAGSEGKVGYWIREPIGVVVAITPFNDPLNLVAHKVGPAIAAGNAVIVKPHSATPLSAIRLAEAFADAGLPPSILQVVAGRGAEIGDRLVSDPRVAMVSFTGGPEVGDRVVRLAGRKKLGLELGANSPAIVLADADLAAAADAIASGGFWAAGQNCLHVQRVIVERSVAPTFRELLVAATKRLVSGPKLDEATDVGPVISDAAADRIMATIAQAVALGGQVVAGGTRVGRRIAPTIVDGLPRTSRLAREEVFGPVVGIIEVDSLDEAIAVANEVEQALHACVFTRDLGSAMRVVHEVDAGGVLVNESTDYRIDSMPFGGVKGSGLGREGVPFAVREMTTTKVVCLNLSPRNAGRDE
ncbi:MAG TPA: aldehyde dehydrogenase family protein [Candidatus Limnocylindrales bacterium]|nr:aldehyde dehydrogenase family protein [Candidatus Limnocylindrales bacterium]